MFWAKIYFMEKDKIAENILNVRLEHGLNQKQFGEKLGFSQRSVSHWENGDRVPTIEVIRKISKLFDITYEELIDG